MKLRGHVSFFVRRTLAIAAQSGRVLHTLLAAGQFVFAISFAGASFA